MNSENRRFQIAILREEDNIWSPKYTSDTPGERRIIEGEETPLVVTQFLTSDEVDHIIALAGDTNDLSGHPLLVIEHNQYSGDTTEFSYYVSKTIYDLILRNYLNYLKEDITPQFISPYKTSDYQN